MEKLLKIFILLPPAKDVKKLILALLFYLLAPVPVGAIVGGLMGLTVILIPLTGIVGTVLGLYGMAGVVFSILTYMGNDLNELFAKKENKEEE